MVLKWGKGTLYHHAACRSPTFSLEILLSDTLAVLKFCWKWNVAMVGVQNGLVCCLEMKYKKS